MQLYLKFKNVSQFNFIRSERIRQRVLLYLLYMLNYFLIVI